MGPPECSGSPEAERTHVTASGRNGQFMKDEFSIETLWGGTRIENQQCGAQDDCTMWWEPQSQSQSPTTTASGSDVGDEDVELGELLSMLDHDNGQQYDETEDAVAIDEVVAMIDWPEEDRQLNQRQQAPLIVSPAVAAAAVYKELSGSRIPLPAIPVPLPPLPVPLVTPLAGLELPTKINVLDRDLRLMREKSTVRSEVSSFSPSPTATCCNVATSAATSRTKKLRRWASVEKECLKQGVALYGEGNWLKIKQHFPHELAGRSNVDLKDKWRNLYGNRQSRKRKQKQSHSACVEKRARLVVAS